MSSVRNQLEAVLNHGTGGCTCGGKCDSCQASNAKNRSAQPGPKGQPVHREGQDKDSETLNPKNCNTVSQSDDTEKDIALKAGGEFYRVQNSWTDAAREASKAARAVNKAGSGLKHGASDADSGAAMASKMAGKSGTVEDHSAAIDANIKAARAHRDRADRWKSSSAEVASKMVKLHNDAAEKYLTAADEHRSQVKSMTSNAFVENCLRELATFNEFESDDQKNAFWGLLKSGKLGGQAQKAGMSSRDADNLTAEANHRSGIASKVNKARQAKEHGKARDAHTTAGKAHYDLGKSSSTREWRDKHMASAKYHFRKAKEHDAKSKQLSSAPAGNSVRNQLEAVLNANPEGYNQYKGKDDAGAGAHEATRDAREATLKAMEASNTLAGPGKGKELSGRANMVSRGLSDYSAEGGSRHAENGHQRVAGFHDEAAAHHQHMSEVREAEGKSESAAKHKRAAERHREASKANREAGGLHHDLAIDKGQISNEANFGSEKQRKFMWSQHPDIAQDWAHGEHSSDGDDHKMPDKTGKDVKGPQAKTARKEQRKGKKMNANTLTANALKSNSPWDHEQAALAHFAASSKTSNASNARLHAGCRADHLMIADQIRNGQQVTVTDRLQQVANAYNDGTGSGTGGGTGKATPMPKPPKTGGPAGFGAGSTSTTQDEEEFKQSKDLSAASKLAAQGAYNQADDDNDMDEDDEDEETYNHGGGGGSGDTEPQNVTETGGGKFLARDYTSNHEGIEFCPRDGSELDDDGECPECGWCVDDMTDNARKRCSKCGGKLGDGGQCAKCNTNNAQVGTKPKNLSYPPRPDGKQPPNPSDYFEDASSELHEDDASATLVGTQKDLPDGRKIADIRRKPANTGVDDDAGHSSEGNEVMSVDKSRVTNERGSAIDRLIENCGGKGGTRGRCKGGAISSAANTASDKSASLAMAAHGNKNADHMAIGDAHDEAATAHSKAAAFHAEAAKNATNAAVKAHHESMAADHKEQADFHNGKAADRWGRGLMGDKTKDAEEASQKANRPGGGSKEDHTDAAAAHDAAAKEAFQQSKEATGKAEKDHFAEKAKDHNAQKKYHLSQANPTGNTLMTTNDFPPDCHAASKNAAQASLDTEHDGAMQSSLNAVKASADGDNREAANQHMDAARQHDKAATSAIAQGNPDGAASQAQAAMLHRMAASHQRNAPPPPDGPTGNKAKEGEQVQNKEVEEEKQKRQQVRNAKRHRRLIQNRLQEVSNMDRQQLIGYLVTNAGEVPDALNGLSDRALRALAVNAAGDFGRFDALGGTFKTSFDQAGGAGEKGEYYERGVKDVFLPPVKIDDPKGSDSYNLTGDDDDDDDDMDDWKEKDLEKGGNRGVTNKQKQPTLNEWLASAPPEAREMYGEWNKHQRIVRNKLIRRLVANVAPAQRQQYADFLNKKQTAELRTLAGLVGNASEFPEGQVVQQQTYNAAPELAPNFLGAAGGMNEGFGGVTNALSKEDGPPLPIARIDWSVENKATVDAIAKAGMSR